MISWHEYLPVFFSLTFRLILLGLLKMFVVLVLFAVSFSSLRSLTGDCDLLFVSFFAFPDLDTDQ